MFFRKSFGIIFFILGILMVIIPATITSYFIYDEIKMHSFGTSESQFFSGINPYIWGQYLFIILLGCLFIWLGKKIFTHDVGDKR